MQEFATNWHVQMVELVQLPVPESHVQVYYNPAADIPERDIGSYTPLAFNVRDGELPLERSPQNFVLKSKGG